MFCINFKNNRIFLMKMKYARNAAIFPKDVTDKTDFVEYVHRVDPNAHLGSEAWAVYETLDALIPDRTDVIHNWSHGGSCLSSPLHSKKWHVDIYTCLAWTYDGVRSNGHIRNPESPQPLKVSYDDMLPGVIRIQSTELSADQIAEALSALKKVA